MTDGGPPYTIEFYADANGRKPVLDWIARKLTPAQRRALTIALEQVLAYEGLDVVRSEFGKPTSESGIYEFRLRQDEYELESRVEAREAARRGQLGAEDENPAESKRRKRGGERVSLRVFFYAHGDKVILLLAGYDKGKNPAPRFESKVIAEASRRLKDHRNRERVAAKARRRGQ